MRLIFNRVTFFCFVLFSISISAQDICTQLNNAIVVAEDGQYLGKICSEYNSESIINEYGSYGNEYNSNSIWNEYGQYGNEFSLMSPFNDITTTPPTIIKN